MRQGRGARRPDKGNHYFPSFSTYIEFKHKVIRFLLRYGSNRSASGRHIRYTPREDISGGRRDTYPLKSTPLLGVKALDVIRMMLPLQNASFYMSHVLVANRVYCGHHRGNVDAQPPRAGLSNIRPPKPPKAAPGCRPSSSSRPPSRRIRAAQCPLYRI